MNPKSFNCKVCGKKGEYKCSKCGKVIYCSRECQFKDWGNHKNNCNKKRVCTRKEGKVGEKVVTSQRETRHFIQKRASCIESAHRVPAALSLSEHSG